MTEQRSGWLGKLLAILGAILSGGFMLNPTSGVFEIPDLLPLVGNLDEFIATLILIYCLRKLGLDIIPGQKKDDAPNPPTIDGSVVHERKP